MKKILALICFSSVLLTSCINDDDVDFDTIGQTFEIDNVDFVGPEYAVNIPFPANVQVFESDVVLVYRLENVFNGEDVWEPLPTATIFFDDGGFAQYRFNFTLNDVDILLESDDQTLLDIDFTDNQIFRIVVVPSAFAQTTDVDLSDLNALQSELNLEF